MSRAGIERRRECRCTQAPGSRHMSKRNGRNDQTPHQAHAFVSDRRTGFHAQGCHRQGAITSGPRAGSLVRGAHGPKADSHPPAQAPDETEQAGQPGAEESRPRASAQRTTPHRLTVASGGRARPRPTGGSGGLCLPAARLTLTASGRIPGRENKMVNTAQLRARPRASRQRAQAMAVRSGRTARPPSRGAGPRLCSGAFSATARRNRSNKGPVKQGTGQIRARSNKGLGATGNLRYDRRAPGARGPLPRSGT